jgi:hypothetical protein
MTYRVTYPVISQTDRDFATAKEAEQFARESRTAFRLQATDGWKLVKITEISPVDAD